MKSASLFLLLLFSLATQAQDRPTRVPYKAGRSTTMAPHGMVATSHPLAAQIGLDILKQGGNAIDAAIATNAAMGLMEPMSCGIGGDLYAIVWDAKTQKLYGLNASGRAPLATSRKYFTDKGMTQIPTFGPLAWSVPGCVDGWDQLRQKFGTMPFEKLLEPSIRYAEEGFPVSEVIAAYWRGAERKDDADFRSVYMNDGKAPRAGQTFKNPALAKSYRAIATDGRNAFYKGDIALSLLKFSKE